MRTDRRRTDGQMKRTRCVGNPTVNHMSMYVSVCHFCIFDVYHLCFPLCFEMFVFSYFLCCFVPLFYCLLFVVVGVVVGVVVVVVGGGGGNDVVLCVVWCHCILR